MSTGLVIYGDSISGNCLKVKWVADHLGLSYEWRETSVLNGETRTPEFLALNPDGRVPVVVLPGGRVLAESNAIILFLGGNSELAPKDPFQRAKMMQWLFWEQYSHEPYIAVRRFHLRYLGKTEDELDPKLIERGNKALALMENQLGQSRFIAGDLPTLADVALVAYTRLAHEGGFDLTPYRAVIRWIKLTEGALGIDAVIDAVRE
ncbi:MAG TPA: glutathione S-transferase family protein [Stellaceae bacterium]|jgi:glutathione S-transferase|nr:glutathione S-transferase family protein [Stellaceae bacterium]